MARIVLIIALLCMGVANAQHGPLPTARPSYPLIGVDIRAWLPIPGYTKINSRYQWIAGAYDSGLHVPQYNGTPSGVRGGVWTADGAIAVDTVNNRFYVYSGGVWNRVANYAEIGNTLYTGDGTLAGNRVVDGGRKTLRFGSTGTPDSKVRSFNVGTYEGIILYDSLGSVQIPNLPVGVNADDSMVVVDASSGLLGYRAIPSGGGGITLKDVSGTPNNQAGTVAGSDLTLHRASQRFPGLNTKYDKQRIDRQGIQVSKYSAISSGAYYDAFASPTAWKDTGYMAFKRGTEHVAPGWLPCFATYDGGQTWDSISVIANPGNNVTLTALNDTLFCSYEDAPATNYQYFLYSANYGRTWVRSDSIDVVGLGSVTFGKYLQLPSGKYIVPYYGYGSSWLIGFFESLDGRDWSVGVTIASGAIGPVELNETWVEIINPDATTDAEVKLISVSRDEQQGGHVQYKSTGYNTWTRVGVIDQFKSTDDLYQFPLEVKLFGGRVYLIGCRRTSVAGPSGAYDFNIGISSADPNLVFSDTSYWSEPNRIYNAEANLSQKGYPNDFGYGFSFLLNGQLLISPFDVSPTNISGDSTLTRIFTMPVFQNVFNENYNGANQSISASTETLVLTPNVNFNTDFSYDSGTGLFTVQTDGTYSIHTICTWQASTTGTYRRAYIKIINPGYATADRVIAEKQIQPSDVVDFNHMELYVDQYLRAGEQIGFYVYSDGADELRNQIETKNRAYISIKK